ncbi:hypothetical protein L1887_14382 [Cichorium endivia]|nr:hypothetical protein L1887_14382 [Cichorium endivia]
MTMYPTRPQSPHYISATHLIKQPLWDHKSCHQNSIFCAMASIPNIFSFHLLLLVLLSLSLQPHARESHFFTKFTRYLSKAPTTSSSPAPAVIPVAEPGLAPGLAPAPAPATEEYGYGLYGHGSSEFSSEEFYTTHETPDRKETLGADEYKSETETETPFEKLLSGESYSTSNNGYSSNNGNGYSSSVNENNGYNKNENGYMESENKIDGYNKNTYSNNGYSQNTYSNNGYNNYDSGYSSSVNENNGYKTDSYSQNSYNNNDNSMSFENENNGYNGNGYTVSEEDNNGYNNNNNRNVMGQQGLSDTRFLENDKNSYDANNNENDQETSYEEEVSDNGEGYYRNNENSKYEFDSMELADRQMGYVKGDP